MVIDSSSRFYMLLLGAGIVALVLGCVGFYNHAKTTGSLARGAAALSHLTGHDVTESPQSWHNKMLRAQQRDIEEAQRVETPEERVEEINKYEQRQYALTAQHNWQAFLVELKKFDKMNQDAVDKVAKTDPAKAAAMAAENKKLHDRIMHDHEEDRRKGFTPAVLAPVLSPQQ